MFFYTVRGRGSGQQVRHVIGSGGGGGGGAVQRHPSSGVLRPGVISLSGGAGGVGGVSSAPSSCRMASPLDGVDVGGGSPGRCVSTVAVAVAPPGERAILRFLLERVSDSPWVLLQQVFLPGRAG